MLARAAVLGGLVVSASGSVWAFVQSLGAHGAQVAQQAAGDPTVLTWASGVSGTAAVGALVYVAKLFARGEVVAREPSAVESQLLEIVAAQQNNERALHELIDQAHKREDRLWTMITTGQTRPT